MNRGCLLSFLLVFAGLLNAQNRQEINLAGTWRVALDSEGAGIEQAWWNRDFDSSSTLPGSLTAQGFGDSVGPDTPWVGMIHQKVYDNPRYDPYRSADNFMFPFWLQPDRYYRGAAWYQRDVTIPKEWESKRVVLHLERPHWETSVWVDGRSVGSGESLSTPHEYDLSGFLTPGRHRLALRIDNSINIDVGRNSHSISDHTQGNWNGVAGAIKLFATDRLWIEDVQVFPDIERKEARLQVGLVNDSGSLASVHLQLRVYDKKGSKVAELKKFFAIESKSSACEVAVPLGEDIQLWDEFDPALYALKVELRSEQGNSDSMELKFGMREIGTRGTQFTINGRPTFLRGTLECAIFPKTGHPSTDVAEWKRIIGTCKAYGLNHMRFHSWCPPEAAFIAADELGFYLQVESGSWGTVGDGKPLDEWLYREGHRITKAYGNHPSFVIMAYGNEPSGKEMRRYLSDWCEYWKKNEPRILHAAAAGWPMLDESELYITHNGTRIQSWGAGLTSVINAEPPQTCFDFEAHLEKYPDKPTISHEIGQWCVYPDFDEIKKYTGPLKARNFEIFREFLDQKGMLDQAQDFLMASGKLQALCYKHDIEASLRTRGFGGFQLLDLHDFPGQGTALVGILDPFWDSKGYVTAKEHRRYCAPIVPLARMDRMVWTNGEVFEADIEVAHFGPRDLEDVRVKWSLRKPGGMSIGKGVFKVSRLETGRNTETGTISFPLKGISKATKLLLEVSIPGTKVSNSWDLWCYPSELEAVNPAGDLRITSHLDDTTLNHLERGGDVLWMIPPDQVKTDVALGFSSIFWNTAWTKGQAPHTMGILCDPRHSALKNFPTDFHSSWQWWDLITHAATIEMDLLPAELRPIVQVVPDWFAPKRLGLVFEATLGKGRLLATSIDLQQDLDQRPVARQMRQSLLKYMDSKRFRPEVRVPVEQLRGLVKP